jgi:uncharacterized BrkB/YihY/UPF0761 family membrane protein
MFLSVGPLVLAAAGLFHAAGSDTNAFATRLIDHQQLSGETARLVQDTFGSSSDNALAASALAVIGFLTWGIGNRADLPGCLRTSVARTRPHTVRPARFTIWFFVLSGILGLFIVFAGSLNTAGWAAVVPVWLVASSTFWLWTPRYLLRRQVGLPQLLPGAVLASVLIGGATATSRFYLGHGLSSDGRQFGSFGVVIALLAWGLILVLISMVCARVRPGLGRVARKRESSVA